LTGYRTARGLYYQKWGIGSPGPLVAIPGGTRFSFWTMRRWHRDGETEEGRAGGTIWYRGLDAMVELADLQPGVNEKYHLLAAVTVDGQSKLLRFKNVLLGGCTAYSSDYDFTVWGLDVATFESAVFDSVDGGRLVAMPFVLMDEIFGGEFGNNDRFRDFIALEPDVGGLPAARSPGIIFETIHGAYLVPTGMPVSQREALAPCFRVALWYYSDQTGSERWFERLWGCLWLDDCMAPVTFGDLVDGYDFPKHDLLVDHSDFGIRRWCRVRQPMFCSPFASSTWRPKPPWVSLAGSLAGVDSGVPLASAVPFTVPETFARLSDVLTFSLH